MRLAKEVSLLSYYTKLLNPLSVKFWFLYTQNNNLLILLIPYLSQHSAPLKFAMPKSISFHSFTINSLLLLLVKI